MNRQFVNRINQLLIVVLVLSPLLSYFIVMMSPIDSGTYFFNAVILFNAIVLLAHGGMTGKLKVPFYLKFLGLFSLYVMISDLFISNKSLTIFYLIKNQVLFGFLAALVIENTAFHASFMRKLTGMLKFLFWTSLVVILVQQFVDYNFLLNPNVREDFEATKEMERRFASIYSYLGGPMLAGFTVIPILGLIVAEKIRHGEKGSNLYYLAGSLFSIIIKARWVIFNLLLTVLVKYRIKKLGFGGIVRLMLGIVTISVICFYVFTALNFNIDELIQQRFLETNRGGLSKGAASSRLIAFEVFGDLFPDNPLFGKGNLKWGEGASGDKELEALLKGRSSQIHVGYLSLFYWYGLAGAILFLFFLYNLMKKLRYNARRNNYWAAYWGMMGFVVANITLVYFSINVAGLLLCLVYNKFYEDELKIRLHRNAVRQQQAQSLEPAMMKEPKPEYHEA